MKIYPYLLILLLLAACKTKTEPVAEAIPEEEIPEVVERAMYIDVHEIGPGEVTAAAVADAHLKDLAIQDSLNVSFIKYWVDEANGKVYCLSEAEKPEDIIGIHTNAHGLVPQHVHQVKDGIADPEEADKLMFLDIHIAEGPVDPEALKEAHDKDLAVQEEFDVNFINYWVDEDEGLIYCLSQAPDTISVYNTHHKAHGMLPVSIAQVTQGE